jgi:hypothetical protein
VEVADTAEHAGDELAGDVDVVVAVALVGEVEGTVEPFVEAGAGCPETCREGPVC